MRKSIPFTLVACFLALLVMPILLSACGGGGGDESGLSGSVDDNSDDNSSKAPEEPTPDPNAKAVWEDIFADEDAGISSANDIYSAKYYFDGALTDEYDKAPDSGDAKFILSGKIGTRFVNVAEGYMFTIPEPLVEGDFTLSENRSRLFAGDAVISVSKEDQSPYGNNADGWEIYLTEWLNRLIGDISFLSANNIMRTSQSKTYTDLIPGYEVMEYNMYIKLSGDIERPYYNIAIIKEVGEYVTFYLVVMKTKSKVNDDFTKMISSFGFFTPRGEAKNHVGGFELVIPEHWSDETKAYFEKLQNNTVPDWGFFYARNAQQYIDWLQGEEGINYKPEIFMTYLHIGYGSSLNYLNMNLINENAGGNGYNGKPVLNLTYQFTTTNNNITGFSPMFDIIRGKYDEHFRKLARDIKEYGKPVIFRLNNEMNTDWTSYCGIVTLLDPDIFVMTWQRLYNIFKEEGVNNTIWVFNPINVTCPFCDWGAYLCYFPGTEYVQMLGLTDYEPGNAGMNSFKTLYTKAYNQYISQFGSYPWMIGEFACGAGGEKQFSWSDRLYHETVLGRSQSNQSAWIKNMFECFLKSSEPGYEFAQKIKAAVWFSTNDYVDLDGKSYIVNYYQLDERLEQTLETLREWLPRIHEGE